MAALQLYGLARLEPSNSWKITLSEIPFLDVGSHLAVFHLEKGSFVWHHGILTTNGRLSKITHMHPEGNISSVSIESFVGNTANAQVMLINHPGVDLAMVAWRANRLIEAAQNNPSVLVYHITNANCEQFVHCCLTGR